MNQFYTKERSQQIVLALLKAHGIRKVVASPGTTNITLVASMQNDPWFEMYSSVDERSAAYMACGLAAESGEPVVLSCTGATASRNYFPGLTEAFYRKLPILAITANQGREKVGHLLAQNIDRSQAPRDAVCLSVSIPSCKDADDVWNCEIQVNRAILELNRHGGGPVHIDLSTRYSRDFSVQTLPPARVIRRITPQDDFPALPEGRIAVFVGAHRNWTHEETHALDAFCSAHDAVVFCDNTSGYYGKYRVQFAMVGCQEQYRSALLNMDILIHLGNVSGDYDGTCFSAKQVWRVSEDGELRDTFRKLSYAFEMDECTFFKRYASKADEQSSYLQQCQAEYTKVLDIIPELPFSNLWMAQQLHTQLPEGSVLHLGILNSLRSWNMFNIPGTVKSYCNVGGFGIDGNVSTLIGASLVHPDKLYFGIVGDLAFFYDMNSLGNHHVGSNIRILLINNGMGTEFRNYNHPGAMFKENAAPYIAAAGHFGNKSSELVKHYAQDLGFEYFSANNKEEFLQHKDRFLSAERQQHPMLFEVFTNHQDESDALYAVRHALQGSQFSLSEKCQRKLKSGIKNGMRKLATTLLERS